MAASTVRTADALGQRTGCRRERSSIGAITGGGRERSNASVSSSKVTLREARNPRTGVRLENSFIPVPGVGETTERTLWRNGCTCWDEFDGSLVGPTQERRVLSFVDEATDRLDADDADYFERALPTSERWRLYEDFRDDALFLDIETTGLDHHRNDVTTVSLHQGSRTRTLVRGDDLTADALAAEIEAAPLLVTFNGARFDVPFLEAQFNHPFDCAHLDLMYPCRRAGLTGGLSAIEEAVGIERDRPDISGRDAVRLWHAHERGEDGALETLIEYNREDTENMKPVADAMAKRLHEEVFEAVCEIG